MVQIKTNVLKGVFWKSISCLCYAVINIIIRYISGGSSIKIDDPLPIHTIILFSYLFGSIIISYKIINKNITRTFYTKYPLIHLIRIIIAIIGIYFWYKSLQVIPVVNAIILGYTGPVIAIIGAIFFLKEKLTINKFITIILCFIGISFINNPINAPYKNMYIEPTIIFPIIAASIFSIDKLITRKLMTLNEDPGKATFFLLIFTGPLCIIPSCILGWFTPGLNHYPWLILLGILSILSNYTYTKAYLFIEVTSLMPITFPLKFISSGIAAYLIFGELPKLSELLTGIILITTSITILNYNKNKLTKV